jgi:AcrR family transcriptional regulator
MEEHEIIAQAGLLFTKYGIKSMTMDDIARQLGVSKKTLYQFVSNKKELVQKAVEMQVQMEQNCICGIFEEKGNAIDNLMEITSFVGKHMKEIHPSVMYDLKKYHPQAWKVLNNHKEQFIYANIKNNLEKGIEDGLYRPNLHPDIVTRFYLCMVSTIIDPEAEMDKYSQSELYSEMMRYHIRGIASEKGRKYLKQKFNQDDV